MTRANNAKRREKETYDKRGESDHRPHGSLWDSASMDYLQNLGAESQWSDLLEEYANDGPVLDIGCGTGELVMDLRQLNPDRPVLGVDISVEQLRKAPTESQGNLFTGDAECLPVPKDTFSAVTARAALHHLPDLESALAEIDRVLDPDGVLLFHEPGAWNPLAVLRRRVLPSDAHTPDEQPFRISNLRSSLGLRFSDIDIESYYIFSHGVPVYNNYAPFKIPRQAMKWVYRAERYIPFGERIAWIYVGIAR